MIRATNTVTAADRPTWDAMSESSSATSAA